MGLLCFRYAESVYNQPQQCMIPAMPSRQFSHQVSSSSAASAPPPSYEEHVLHYPGERMHYPQYHSAVLYNDYDPEGNSGFLPK